MKIQLLNNNLENNVFLNEVTNMQELRSRMDVELMCSTCEAFGRVTIEGMHSSLVVISANAGATPEIIQDGINGILSESGNQLDLSDKIEKVYLNRDYAKQISDSAYNFSKTHFTMEQNVEQIENFLREIFYESSSKE